MPRSKSESRHVTDRISARPVAALAATLDRSDPWPHPGDSIPPLAHWLYCLDSVPQSGIGPDGHPAHSGLMPSVPLPRRMFAGSTIEFLHPIRIGDRVERTSEITDVRQKEGRTGLLVFVTLRQRILAGGTLALIEDQTIVYRGESSRSPAATEQPAEPRSAMWRREITPTEVMLFRFSALTFNAHRIHYDYDYATQVEGYPGLVVHGPLVATLLADLIRRNAPQDTVRRFAFRAQRPLFAPAAFAICGNRQGGTVSLWAETPTGHIAVDATAELAPR
jgi:3-methylfumaryl-CoA hydratase